MKVKYLDCVNKFSVADVSVSVLVELVVDSSQFLGSHENSNLRYHFLELELVKGARLVEVEILFLC